MNPVLLPAPQAVIFDFDGILADTEPIHYEAFRKVLEPHGLGFSWQEYIETYMGFDDRDAFREAFRAKGRVLGDAELSDLIHAKSREFLEAVRNGVRAYPGAVALVGSLHAEGRPLALCSGALRADIDPILAGMGIDRCFEVIVSAEEVSRSKPDPESYALAFRRLSLRHPASLTIPGESIAVEDTPAGIRSAKGAGLRVLAVTNSHGAGELSGADWTVDSLLSVRFGGGDPPPARSASAPPPASATGSTPPRPGRNPREGS